MDAPDEMHYRDCGSIGGGWPHPASAHALDELVEAVAQVLLPWLLPPTRASIDYPLSAARAVLSVPALAEVIARPPALEVPAVVCAMRRDASVLDLVGQRDQRGATWCMDRIAALYPEAGK